MRRVLLGWINCRVCWISDQIDTHISIWKLEVPQQSCSGVVKRFRPEKKVSAFCRRAVVLHISQHFQCFYSVWVSLTWHTLKDIFYWRVVQLESAYLLWLHKTVIWVDDKKALMLPFCQTGTHLLFTSHIALQYGPQLRFCVERDKSFDAALVKQ